MDKQTKPRTLENKKETLGNELFVLRSRPPFIGVPRRTGLKVPHGAFFEQLWAPVPECPKECFLAEKMPKKHSKNPLWGTPRRVPQIAQKALRGALSGPGTWALL